MPLALLGIGVSRGVAIGRARLLQPGRLEIPEYQLTEEQVEAEVERFQQAVEAARRQLGAIRNRVPQGVADETLAFIDAHLLMLEDAALTATPVELIRERRYNAEWALQLHKDNLVKAFEEAEDAYLRTRRDDVEHVVCRIQQVLLDETSRDEMLAREQGRGRVVLADDLSPGELILLHQQEVAALVTERGGATAHTAILARSLGIPAVVGVRRAQHYIADGETLVVDGVRGTVLVGLDRSGYIYFRRRQNAEHRARAHLRGLRDTPAVTRDGVAVELQANIELPEDLDAIRRVGAEGIGLYRTEFLYMNRDEPPDEEEQFETYRYVVRRLKGAPITIRTLDLGGDKTSESSRIVASSALGLRAVRWSLKDPTLFRTQLRAILRASALGPVRILVPMLTNLHEVRQVRRVVDAVREELTEEGVAFDPAVPLGGMIEVPAAAVCADSFAEALDFLSIGTNDLIQYTLAVDRIDEEVSHLYDPLHPAVLRLIGTTLEAGERSDTPVAMCGEMAGDPQLTRLLLGLGLTRFSMPPATLLEVKRIITASDVGQLRRQVRRVLRRGDRDQLGDLLEQLNRAE